MPLARPGLRRLAFTVLALAGLLALAPLQAAKRAPRQAAPPAAPAAPAATQPGGAPMLAARAWLLIDITTGQTLAASEPDLKVEPASLTKLMTAHLVFSALTEKKLSGDQRPPVSQTAWKAIGSRMFVDPANPATVNELMQGMIIQSGNDASIILAEALGGTEAGFAEMMNREAKRLGMANTQFRNATGLPDPGHYSTSRDLATLAVSLINDHPQLYELYSRKEYTYNGIRQPNRNRLLFIDPSVDGVKTGHTEAAGYCLIASARREQVGTGVQRRLLSVVVGTASETARAVESQKLLNWGFQGTEAVKLFGKDQPSGTYRVWKGTADEVKAGFDRDMLVAVPRGQAAAVKAEIERVQPLVAPISRGQRIGTLRVRLGDQVLLESPVLALQEVPQAGIFGRAWDTIRLWMER
ncbi:MAG: D-alanyl-D-alanine carboxypeptidase [Burkholderiales bacterium]|nr:D-alanyl-D-alanine carboxypeptidase [Burkholderiales bacterium]